MPGKTRNAIGSRIRELRVAKKLTLEQLSARVGISPSHLSRLERGQTSPSFTVAAALARELGITVGELDHIQRTQTDIDRQLVSLLCDVGVSLTTAEHIRDAISSSARAELLRALSHRD